VLLTTHYLAEAEALANRIAVIHRGELLAEGTPVEIKGNAASLEDAFVAMTESQS
jgi:ABC-2 type transport system ATP-binding protein